MIENYIVSKQQCNKNKTMLNIKVEGSTLTVLKVNNYINKDMNPISPIFKFMEYVPSQIDKNAKTISNDSF